MSNLNEPVVFASKNAFPRGDQAVPCVRFDHPDRYGALGIRCGKGLEPPLRPAVQCLVRPDPNSSRSI